MRLISCHIENFGKLSELDISFQDGFNQIYEKNGWGKSTLMAFLKAMFYGFEREKKRSRGTQERRKYKPWQGGVYGGSVLFETKEVYYQIERCFGATPKEDQFVLRNAKTGMVTTAYGSNLGRELFQLDADSFQRTIYVSQLGCVTGATDNIHAKIGNLTQQMYDLNHFSEASELLQKKMNQLTPNRKTGEIAKLQIQVYQYQNTLIDIEEKQKKSDDLQEEYLKKKEEQKQLLQEQEKLKKEFLTYGDKKEKEAIAMFYRELLKQEQEKEEELEQMEEIFGGGVPQLKEMKHILSFAEQEQLEQVKIDENRLTEQEEKMWDFVQENWKGLPTNAEIKKYLEALEWEEEEKISVLLWVGIGIAVAGGIVCFIKLLFGIVLLIVGISMSVFVRKKVILESDEESENVEAADETEMDTFLQAYPIMEEKNEQEHLYTLQAMMGELQGIQKRIEAQQNANKVKDMCAKEIETFFQTFHLKPEEDKGKQLKKLGNMLEKYYNSLDAYELAQNKRKEFARKHKIESDRLDLEFNGPDINNIQVSLQEKEEEGELLQKKIIEMEKQISDLEELAREEVDIKKKLDTLLHKIEKKQHQYELLTLTKDTLQQAKESLTAKYKNPLQQSFDAYISIVDPKLSGVLSLDVNMQVRKREKGMERESQLLSAGYQDLIGICLRLAMIDAMYQNDTPFLILDDPFVNLDDAKLEGAKKVLQRATEKYQIIYCCCQENRCLE